METLGNKLKKARLELHMTQEQLAGESFTKSYISQIERGKANPSLKALKILAARLGKPLAYFLGDVPQNRHQAMFLLALGEGHLEQSRHAEALECAQEAQQVAEILENPELLGGAERLQASVYLAQQDYTRAETHIRRALDAFEGEDLKDQVAESYLLLGQLHHRRGLHAKAVEAFKRAAQAYNEASVKDDLVRLRALVEQGNVYLRLQDDDLALDCFNEALGTVDKVRDDRSAAGLLLGLGILCRSRGEDDKALSYAFQALALFRRANAKHLLAAMYHHLGQLYGGRNQWDRASGYYEQSLVLSQSLGNRPAQAATLTAMANHWLAQGKLDQAQNLCERALGLLKEKRDPADQVGVATLTLARVKKAQGDADAAVSLFEKAIAVFEGAKLVRKELAQAYTELGRLLNERGDFARAAEHLSRANEILMAQQNAAATKL